MLAEYSERPGKARRATIDPDGYRGGFASWSGTSFSAPVLAGELAEAILVARERGASPAAGDWRSLLAARTAAAWHAIEKSTGLAAP